MATGHKITIEIPDDLYQELQQVAEQSAQSIEATLLAAAQEQIRQTAEPFNRLADMSDAGLWQVVYHRLSAEAEARWRDLAEQNNAGLLNEREFAELEMLVNQINQQMLLRTEALVLLKQRGHDIDDYRA